MDRDVGGPGKALSSPPRLAGGFALVETLLAALLLAVGTLALAGSLRAAWQGLTLNAASARAVNRLSDLAEALRAAEPADRPSVATAWLALAGAGATAEPSPDPAGGIARWRARVEWTDRSGSPPAGVVQWIGLPP